VPSAVESLFGLGRLLAIGIVSAVISLILIIVILTAGLIPMVFLGEPFTVSAEVIDLLLIASFLMGTPLASVHNSFAEMNALRKIARPASFRDLSAALMQAINKLARGMEPVLFFRLRGAPALAILPILSAGGMGPLLLPLIVPISSFSARAEIGISSVFVVALGIAQLASTILLIQTRPATWPVTVASSAFSIAYSPVGAALRLLAMSQGIPELNSLASRALLATNLGRNLLSAFPLSLATILYLTSRRLHFLFGRPTASDLNAIGLLNPGLAALTFGARPVAYENLKIARSL